MFEVREVAKFDNDDVESVKNVIASVKDVDASVKDIDP